MNASSKNKIISELKRAKNIITIWLNSNVLPNLVKMDSFGMFDDSNREGGFIDKPLVDKFT